MDVCEMCAHHIKDDDDDIYCCNQANCYEMIEFVALPIYEAAPDMYEALKAIIDAFDKLSGGLPDSTFTEPYFKMFHAVKKAEGKPDA